MDDQVGQNHLLEGGPERLDQIVWELADEPDRVGDRGSAPAGELDPPRRGVERREELVGHDHPRPGQPVHEGRLPGVGITGDRDLGDPGVLTARSLQVARLRERLDVATELRDPSADVLAVDLHLRLARPSGPMPPPSRLIASPQPRRRGRR